MVQDEDVQFGNRAAQADVPSIVRQANWLIARGQSIGEAIRALCLSKLT